jgi:hypothetical protein
MSKSPILMGYFIDSFVKKLFCSGSHFGFTVIEIYRKVIEG